MMKRNKMKLAVASSMALMGGCFVLSNANVQATTADFTSTTKHTSKLSIQEVDYDLDDRYDAIEMDFYSNIKLKSNATVSVKDASGTSYKTSISEVDHDDLSLDVTGLKAGKSYTVKIKGIKKSSASKYGTLTVKFSIPKSSLSVQEVEYDAKDHEVTFDFNKSVTYKNPKVVITNTSGTKTYTTRIVERDSDELTVRVSDLKQGSSYKYTITGISSNGTSKTLSGTFSAVDFD